MWIFVALVGKIGAIPRRRRRTVRNGVYRTAGILIQTIAPVPKMQLFLNLSSHSHTHSLPTQEKHTLHLFLHPSYPSHTCVSSSATPLLESMQDSRQLQLQRSKDNRSPCSSGHARPTLASPSYSAAASEYCTISHLVSKAMDPQLQSWCSGCSDSDLSTPLQPKYRRLALRARGSCVKGR